MSWLHNLNRDPNDPNSLGGVNGQVYTFKQLPEHIQNLIKALWAKGVIIEVFGVVSRAWQPITQKDLLLEGNKYYRLKGAANYAVLKPIGVQKEKYIYVSDPTTLPDTTLVYQATKDGKQQAVQIHYY